MKHILLILLAMTVIKSNAQNSFPASGDVFVHGRIISSGSGDLGGALEIRNSSKTANGVASNWIIYNMAGAYGNALQFWAYDNVGCAGGMCTSRFTLMDNGNVGIGTTTPSDRLSVNGKIRAHEIKVELANWPDFVFAKNYVLPTLAETEKHIKEKGHLPGIPSATEVEKNGIELGDMNKKLLQKIEELTLYLIEMKKENESQRFFGLKQQKQIAEQQKDIKILKSKLK